ncbi:MAG: rRNA maturation RNase YbeY [Bacteroidetes bacterium]|nr:rRNA maturation RNase YbeY [Bacteroidota bacterium]
MNAIQFLGKSRFLDQKTRNNLRSLLHRVAKNKGWKINQLTYVVVDDEHLLSINVEHLQHNTYTDIITFDLSDGQSKGVDGEIYISIDRVKENAIIHHQSVEMELVRVVSHGLLHLLGFKDKSPNQAKEMRQEEEACLSLWSSLN